MSGFIQFWRSIPKRQRRYCAALLRAGVPLPMAVAGSALMSVTPQPAPEPQHSRGGCSSGYIRSGARRRQKQKPFL